LGEIASWGCEVLSPDSEIASCTCENFSWGSGFWSRIAKWFLGYLKLDIGVVKLFLALLKCHAGLLEWQFCVVKVFLWLLKRYVGVMKFGCGGVKWSFDVLKLDTRLTKLWVCSTNCVSHLATH